MMVRRAGLVVVLALLCSAPAHAASDDVRIDVLSNRADVISGGDALVQVVRPPDARSAPFKVRVGDRDVTRRFGDDGIGLIDGLDERPQRRDGDARRRPQRPDHDHEPPDRRAGVRRRAAPAVDLPGGRRGRAVQPADGRLLPVHGRGERDLRELRPEEPAGGFRHRDDEDRPGQGGPLRRPRGGRRAGPRQLRDRGARRPRGMEPQAADALRPQHRAPLLAAQRVAGARRQGAVARLHGRQQRPPDPRREHQRRRLDRGVHDAQGAHRRVLRPGPLHDGRGLLGRLLPVDGRGDVPRAARRAAAQLHVRRPVDDGVRRLRLRAARALLLGRGARGAAADGQVGAGDRRPQGAEQLRGVGRDVLRLRRSDQRRPLQPRPEPRLPPGDEPRRRALHDRRLHVVDLRLPAEEPVDRAGEEDRPRVRERPLGQRGGAVRPRRPAIGADHAGRVRRPQPEDRRHHDRREASGRPQRGRREHGVDRVPQRRGDGRLVGRGRPDHRSAGLQRERARSTRAATR